MREESLRDAQQDLKSLAWQLVSDDGEQVWACMSNADKIKLQEVFQGCKLDLTESRRTVCLRSCGSVAARAALRAVPCSAF